MLTNPPVPYDFCTGVPISYLLTMGVNAHLAQCLNSVSNVNALVGTFKQVKRFVYSSSTGSSFIRHLAPRGAGHSGHSRTLGTFIIINSRSFFGSLSRAAPSLSRQVLFVLGHVERDIKVVQFVLSPIAVLGKAIQDKCSSSDSGHRFTIRMHSCLLLP